MDAAALRVISSNRSFIIIIFNFAFFYFQCKVLMLRKTYSMMLNVLERKQFESKEIGNLMFRVSGLTEKEGFQLRQREAGEDRLEYSFLHLDSILLVLRDM